MKITNLVKKKKVTPKPKSHTSYLCWNEIIEALSYLKDRSAELVRLNFAQLDYARDKLVTGWFTINSMRSTYRNADLHSGSDVIRKVDCKSLFAGQIV